MILISTTLNLENYSATRLELVNYSATRLELVNHSATRLELHTLLAVELFEKKMRNLVTC